MSNTKNDARLIMGGILIVIGILFLLDNFYYIDISHILITYWPLVLILLGILKLVRVGNFNHGGAWLLIGLGLLFQTLKLNYLFWWQVERYWPVVLIAIGIMILFSHKRGRDKDEDMSARESATQG